MPTHVAAPISDDLHERITRHPLRGGRTQAQFIEHVLANYLETPESLKAEHQAAERRFRTEMEMKERRIETLEQQLEETKRRDPEPDRVDNSPADGGVNRPAASRSPGGSEFYRARIQAAAPGQGENGTVLIDITLVPEADPKGEPVIDRIRDCVGDLRGDCFKRAAGIDVATSIASHRDQLLGMVIYVRTEDVARPDGFASRRIFYRRALPAFDPANGPVRTGTNHH